jgi:multisubunit Na+/H+ antiporter MnhC subunit
MGEMGRVLIGLGVLLVVVGVALVGLGRLAGGGWLPGDIVWQRRNLTVVFPIVTCLIISIVATLILNLFLKR